MKQKEIEIGDLVIFKEDVDILKEAKKLHYLSIPLVRGGYVADIKDDHVLLVRSGKKERDWVKKDDVCFLIKEYMPFTGVNIE